LYGGLFSLSLSSLLLPVFPTSLSITLSLGGLC
jgi:hypothetical protein